MKIIKIIRDQDFGFDAPEPAAYLERRAARAIIFDESKNVALLHATKNNYHKLPGGGIEEKEEITQALEREAQEEIGCALQNIHELGIIEEYRNKYSLRQISYCFLADLKGEKGTPHLEADEIAEGFQTVWMSLDQAIKVLNQDPGTENYEGQFMQARDLTFLVEASKVAYEK